VPAAFFKPSPSAIGGTQTSSSDRKLDLREDTGLREPRVPASSWTRALDPVLTAFVLTIGRAPESAPVAAVALPASTPIRRVGAGRRIVMQAQDAVGPWVLVARRVAVGEVGSVGGPEPERHEAGASPPMSLSRGTPEAASVTSALAVDGQNRCANVAVGR